MGVGNCAKDPISVKLRHLTASRPCEGWLNDGEVRSTSLGCDTSSEPACYIEPYGFCGSDEAKPEVRYNCGSQYMCGSLSSRCVPVEVSTQESPVFSDAAGNEWSYPAHVKQ